MRVVLLHDAIDALIGWFENASVEEQQHSQQFKRHLHDEISKIRDVLQLLGCRLACILHPLITRDNDDVIVDQALTINEQLGLLLPVHHNRWQRNRRAIIILIETERILSSVLTVIGELLLDET